jgi:protein-tyrosine-phosphatase
MGSEPGVDHKPFNVLFLCTGNSARSVMAEAIMNRIGPPKFNAWSAGSMPKGAVHPLTLEVLRGNHFLVDQFRSKSWEEFSGPGAPVLDFVFTVCDDAAAEVCPIWPGQPMSAHWGLPDPVQASGNAAQVALAFADTFRMLRHRIEVFVNLPVASLDRLTLQRRLDEIGKAGITATTAS